MNTEQQEVGMHASFIDSLMRKEPNRFFTFREITERTKEAQWSKFDHIGPALEQLKSRGVIERDETYGYCMKGQSKRLREDMAKPKISRAELDSMTPEAQMEYFKNGGSIK